MPNKRISPRPPVSTQCPQCKATFVALQSQLDRGSIYCGKACWVAFVQTTSRNTLLDRFWSKVAKGNDCWVWLAGKTAAGYGMMWVEQRQTYAHRLSWQIAHDADPGDFQVLHACDNPPCVRPEHLFLGTAADNVHDMISKDRQAKGDKVRHEGEHHPMARLTENQVIEIRAMYANSRFSYRTLAAIFSVSPSSVEFIIKRKTWKHL